MQPTISELDRLNSGTQTNYGHDQLVQASEYRRSTKYDRSQSIPNDIWENISCNCKDTETQRIRNCVKICSYLTVRLIITSWFSGQLQRSNIDN